VGALAGDGLVLSAHDKRIDRGNSGYRNGGNVRRIFPSLGVALGGLAIPVLVFVWAITLKRDYLLGEMNLVPLYLAALIGAILFIGGVVALSKRLAQPVE
jgi:hypothetical protein